MTDETIIVRAQQVTPRRSALSVPASSPEMLAKSPLRGADEVVIDLEDGVATAAKDRARGACIDALDRCEGQRVAVRVNPIGSQWCHSDPIALASLRQQPHSVVIPKVESAADIAFVDRLLNGVEAAAGRSGPRLRRPCRIHRSFTYRRCDPRLLAARAGDSPDRGASSRTTGDRRTPSRNRP
jgi:hypothetical protein